MLILLAAGVFYYRPYIENLYLQSKEKVQDSVISPLSLIQKEAQKDILAPPPLKSEKESAQSFLTQKGVD